MQFRNKREKMLVFLGIPVALIVLVWSLLDSSSKPTGGKNEPLPLEKALDTRDKARREYRALTEDQTQIEPRIKEIAYDLPAEQLVPRVIRDLQTIAAKSHVHLREIKPLRPRLTPSGQGTRVPLEVRFRATFQPDTVRFLYYLEDPQGRMVVDKLNITSADAKFKTVDVSAQVTVFTSSAAGVSKTGAEGGEPTDATTQGNRS